MIRLALVGAKGRMGLAIKRAMAEFTHIQIFQEVCSAKQSLEYPVDVVMDFSKPCVTLAVAAWCQQNQVPLVSGTTGLGLKQKTELKCVAQNIPVLYAENFSIGMTILKILTNKATAMLTSSAWHATLMETHHIHKKDAPSGSALALRQAMADIDSERYNTPIHSLRLGSYVGKHQVIFAHPEETLTFQHEAHDRMVFAKGALSTIPWIIKQKPGKYNLEDYLNTQMC